MTPFAASSTRRRHARLAGGATLIVFGLVGAGSFGAVAQAPVSVRVLASNGIKAALVASAAACEAEAGTSVGAVFDTSSALRARAERGEAFDVAFMTADVVDALAGQGYVDLASRRLVARTRIGVGVLDGSPVPDIGTPEAVRRLLLAVPSLTYAGDGASRPHLERMFGRLGLTEALGPKVQLEQGSTRATARVLDGRAAIVLTLVSEIVPVRGLRLAGTLPSEFQGDQSFAVAVGSRAAQPLAAARLGRCLAAPAREAVYRSVGLEGLAP